MRREAELAAQLVHVVKESLRDGKPVELDGLGLFLPDGKNGMRFIPETAPRVFIAYVDEDCDAALRLADSLTIAGMKVWIDKRRLLPGQDWRRAIERAIEWSDLFVACFSRAAVRKRGQFPLEVRLALRCAEKMPLDDWFVIPVRLDECSVPRRVSITEYVDLFPEWEEGLAKLVRAIEGEIASRKLRDAA
jgi:hypothetical protein